MPKSESRASPLQRFIARSAAALKLTRYELAKRCGWSPNSIYRKLTRPTRHTSMERMLAAMAAHITVNGETVRMRLTRNGEVRIEKTAAPQAGSV